ncbi:hypothetical protein ACFL3N_02530 [Candidatus Omnitrophota bacterium]
MKCKNHPEIDAVTQCALCGIPVCDNCRTITDGNHYCKECIAKGGGKTPINRRSPGLAAFLSLIIAGSGQMYNGQIGKGLFILFTFWLIIPWLYGVFDAFFTAKKINEGKIAFKPRYGCLIAVAVAIPLMFVFVAIMGLLAAIAIPNFIKAREAAMKNAGVAGSPASRAADRKTGERAAGVSGRTAGGANDMLSHDR